MLRANDPPEIRKAVGFQPSLGGYSPKKLSFRKSIKNSYWFHLMLGSQMQMETLLHTFRAVYIVYKFLMYPFGSHITPLQCMYHYFFVHFFCIYDICILTIMCFFWHVLLLTVTCLFCRWYIPCLMFFGIVIMLSMYRTPGFSTAGLRVSLARDFSSRLCGALYPYWHIYLGVLSGA